MTIDQNKNDLEELRISVKEKDEQINGLAEQVIELKTAKELQDNTIDWLKSQIEELRTRSTHSENNIENNDGKIAKLLGKYLDNFDSSWFLSQVSKTGKRHALDEK